MPLAKSPEEVTLTFRVPESDFDGIAVFNALVWLEEQVRAHPDPGYFPSEEGRVYGAYRIVKCLHDRYMDTVGHPEWKRPLVPFGPRREEDPQCP